MPNDEDAAESLRFLFDGNLPLVYNHRLTIALNTNKLSLLISSLPLIRLQSSSTRPTSSSVCAAIIDLYLPITYEGSYAHWISPISSLWSQLCAGKQNQPAHLAPEWFVELPTIIVGRSDKRDLCGVCANVK